MHLPVRLARSTAVLVLVTGGLVACTGSHHRSAQESAAQNYLTAFGAADAAGAARDTDDPGAARPTLTANLTGLGSGTHGTLHVTGVDTSGDRATAKYTASWTLPGTAAHWTYHGTLPLARHSGTWRVVWRASDVHPSLPAGTHLQVQRDQPPRAALEDSSGAPLFAKTPVVRVGVEPKLVTNLPKLAAALAKVQELQSTAQEITRAVRAARPTDFVPVITLRRPVYERIRRVIYDLPGTVFQTDTLLLTPSAGFGQPLLGTVGAATKDIVSGSHGRVAAGDQTGVGGLQQAYDHALAGRAGVSVVAAPDAGAAPARRIAVVTPPVPGKPVRLTLDRSVQVAAEHALAGVHQAAAIVAVRRSTGELLADANSAATTYDFGLAGAFPPGSTFKIATWAAAFTARPSLTPQTKVACPATTTVDGRHFVNENKFSYPPVPVSAAFGYSCNTSAITEALTLPASALANTAKSLGLGAHWSLPVSAFSGSVPPPATQTERAADAIGQGRVLASPLLMALMAGAVTSGRVLAPHLTAGAAPSVERTLPSGLVAKMNTLMKATVQLPAGTGHVLAPIGGVEGKTGTAEYGTDTPPRSHSWFAGTKGDLAFAVFVYDGASAHVEAAPLARDFLAATR